MSAPGTDLFDHYSIKSLSLSNKSPKVNPPNQCIKIDSVPIHDNIPLHDLANNLVNNNFKWQIPI